MLPRDSRTTPLHYTLDVAQSRHRRIAGRRHRESSVSSTTIYCKLRRFTDQEAIYQPRGKGIPTPDAIEDFKVGPERRLKQLIFGKADRSPVIDRGSFCVSQSCCYNLEIRIIGHGPSNHLLEIRNVQLRKTLVDTFDF